MGFIPDQLNWSSPRSAPVRLTEAACLFCAQRPEELYLLPTFGLASPDELASLACADCYQQTTFTSPRQAARVVFGAHAA
jgi:hypothetical protein